jgi:hypothetical protein
MLEYILLTKNPFIVINTFVYIAYVNSFVCIEGTTVIFTVYPIFAAR